MGAELWALRDGLKMASDLHFFGLEVEMDALQAIALLHSHQFDHHPLSSIIRDYRQHLEMCRVREVCHVRREAKVQMG